MSKPKPKLKLPKPTNLANPMETTICKSLDKLQAFKINYYEIDFIYQLSLICSVYYKINYIYIQGID